ncbi:MAG TPA: alpha/beta hydrolase [Candidatus Limnocylindrales bacterium]|nr:alpha/beta hydrolase [Candidatus Limnocylindrales bacterium]
MEVRMARNGDVRLAYETFGTAGGEPLLLIMGLDFQMVWWPDGFCRALADHGFHVARFDNRDTGLSTHFRSAGKTPYTTYDMVEDGIAVMTDLGWGSAHVVGGSLGGAIAVATAIVRPERVRTLVAMMTSPTRPLDILRYLKIGILLRFTRVRHPATDEGAVETLVDIARLLSSPEHPFDEEWARRTAELSHARAPRDLGTTRRQMAAGRAASDLARRTGEITAPTLVINGADDPLIRPSGAAALARRIPGARSMVYPGMGHTVPEHLWPALVDTIAEHAAAKTRLR